MVDPRIIKIREEMTSRGITRTGISGGAYAAMREMWPVLRELDFNKLKVLDVGCGSMFYPVEGAFQPWLARTFAKLGADVTGIDILPGIPNEPYNHVQMDLRVDSLRSRFQPNSLDLVVSTNLFDDPTTSINEIGTPIFRKITGDIYEILKPGKRFFTICTTGKNPEEVLRDIGFEISQGLGLIEDTYFCRKPE